MTGTASRFGIGKVLISLAAVTTGVGPFRYDWNDTHIYNPTWPPHAKFHNAQTMSLGASLSLVSLYQLWKATDTPRAALDNAAIAASLYWLTQITAGFYPARQVSTHPRSTPGRNSNLPSPP